jgi:hypothetical protein
VRVDERPRGAGEHAGRAVHGTGDGVSHGQRRRLLLLHLLRNSRRTGTGSQGAGVAKWHGGRALLLSRAAGWLHWGGSNHRGSDRGGNHCRGGAAHRGHQLLVADRRGRSGSLCGRWRKAGRERTLSRWLVGGRVGRGDAGSNRQV